MDKVCVYCIATDSEVKRLADFAQSRGWIVASTVTEQPSTAPEQRTGLTAIRRMVAKGDVQALVVPSLLMLGASLDETVALIAKMAASGVHLIAETEGIDTTKSESAAWMTAVASLERYKEAVRRQKVRAGQLRALAAGVRFGRPAISDTAIRNVRAALAAGNGIRPTARKMGISPARVATEKKAMGPAKNFSQEVPVV